MRQVTYAGGSFITSDEIANAVLRYAAALANADRAATLRVPVVGSEGQAEVELLVGPSSQILAEPIDVEWAAPDGAAFVAHVDELVQGHERRYTLPEATGSLDWDV